MGKDAAIFDALKRYWGFDALRPLQEESVRATLSGRDSLTVLPTGGGKSLCFQLPPLVDDSLTVVVSPLIALMQDQVAGLEIAGVPAAAAQGALSAEQFSDLRTKLLKRELRLLFVAPERMFSPSFMSMLVKADPRYIAIDEAHCISQWGHDFRPEYRRLRELRAILPNVVIGAYTATATPRVQEDIVEQLALRDPAVLVGDFDRPNLTYRILPRSDAVTQIAAAIGRHDSASASIVYCITRKRTEEVAGALKKLGIRAAAYHAGLDASVRSKISSDFKDERLNVVVATVAFGMGIDRSDVRLVVHESMPKTVEAYQQETGRAGRDGLPAECVMLYSNADAFRWREIMESSLAESEVDVPEDWLEAQNGLLDRMQQIATGVRCRHRALSEYFGREYAKDDCGACDVCLRELVEVPGAQDIARKIVSCVARIRQHALLNGSSATSFGSGHLANVLLGSKERKVLDRGHDSLSTYGILRGSESTDLQSYINQLIDAGALQRMRGEYATIDLGEKAGALLRNEVQVRLLRAPTVLRAEGRGARDRKSDAPALTPRERELFEILREIRREMSREQSVPPYVIASDAVLEELCRRQPTDVKDLTAVRGIGERKAKILGARITDAIREFRRAVL